MYTLTDKVVESLVKRAVDYGVSSCGKKDNTLVLHIAVVWMGGDIAVSSLTEDDSNQLYETLNKYHFKDEEE